VTPGQKKRIRGRLLAGMLAVCVLATGACLVLKRQAPHPGYARMAAAAQTMERLSAAVRGYKQDRGISIDPAADVLGTGLIGPDASAVVTTMGALASKRTSADPVMAALCVRLLLEAGVTAGDRVGCCFSGSFPGLALATICAVEAIGAQPVVIASVGASTYGATDETLTLPEILLLLHRDGFISEPPIAITPGGEHDTGSNMFGVLLPGDFPDPETVYARIEALGAPMTNIPEFEENLTWRMGLYGDISCFVNTGGNVMALGRNDRGLALGVGLLRGRGSAHPDAGLLERYLNLGVPVIHLLNLKRLVADYGLPYDPPALAGTGAAAVYYQTEYPRALIAAALAAVLALLLLYRWPERCCYGHKPYRQDRE